MFRGNKNSRISIRSGYISRNNTTLFIYFRRQPIIHIYKYKYKYKYSMVEYTQLKHIQLCIFYHAVFVFVYVNYGISDPVLLSIFGVHLLMFVQVDVTFMRDLRLFQCYHLVSM